MKSKTEKLVLIIEDSRVDAALLARALKGRYCIRICHTAELAYAAIQQKRPDLIVLDLELPGMSGSQFLSKIRSYESYVSAPVLVLTHATDSSVEKRLLADGAQDFLRKPFDAETLIFRIENAFGAARAEDVETSYQEAIEMLGLLVHYRDTSTELHVMRVAEYARAIARAHGLSDKMCEAIYRASPLHDTGKIAVPDSVLKKPGPLNTAEWKIMKSHSEIGYRILKRGKSEVFQLAAEIALHHHERWDGTGYPHGLRGEEIPLPARITSVADVFDSLMSDRFYKSGWGFDETVDHIKANSGTMFDPFVIQTFCDCLDELMVLQSST